MNISLMVSQINTARQPGSVRFTLGIVLSILSGVMILLFFPLYIFAHGFSSATYTFLSDGVSWNFTRRHYFLPDLPGDYGKAIQSSP